MVYVYLVVMIAMLAVLTLQLAWRWDFSPLSSWQQHQLRSNKITPKQTLEQQRWQLYPVLRSLIVFKMMLEAGILLFILQQLQPKDWTIFLKWLGLLLISWLIAKIWLIERWSRQLYLKFEPKILSFASKISWLGLAMLQQPTIQPPVLTSRQELEYLLEHDQRVLSDTERQIMQATADFVELRAQDLMVPLEKLTSVKSTELLGPLKINELYQTGEQLFVVTTKTGVMGLIQLDDLTNLTSGESYQARQLARRDFLEVPTEADLIEVITQLMEQNAQVALVGDSQQILGIIKLETILKQLKIVNL